MPVVSAALALCTCALAVQSGSVTTTIYVGRHFEVRDQDQPTKYVFDGATRVAEITGSLSSNARTQRLRLYPGWNLCSLAVSGPFPASGADAISAVYQWNPGTHDYSQLAMAQSTAAGTVLWIKARTNAVVSVLGAYADPVPQQLQAGGAYLAGSGLEAWSPGLPGSASTWDFDASTAKWFDDLTGGLATVSDPPTAIGPGQAFYVKAAAPVELQIPDPILRIRYYHQDHLCSSSVMTDASGALVEETAFYPFGVPRNEFRPRQVEDPYKFTQKERDRESGLHYFEARYLAGRLSRFIMPDQKYANCDLLSAQAASSLVSNPQQINLYAYVRNNPLRYTDPDGLEPAKKYMEFKLDEVYIGDVHGTEPEKENALESRQKATFSDQPWRYTGKGAAMWRATLSAVCQKEAGKSDYETLDTMMYGFDIDASGNLQLFNPGGGSGIHVSTFAPYNAVKSGRPVAGVTINADYTGSCGYSLRWVQTVLTTSPHPGCGAVYNDPCVSDDPPGRWLPFYWTDKQLPAQVRELDRNFASYVHATLRQMYAQPH